MPFYSSITDNKNRWKHNIALLGFVTLLLYPLSVCRPQNSIDWHLRQEAAEMQKDRSELFSPSCAQQFIRIADELRKTSPVTTDNPQKIKQSIIFLLAADRLNPAETQVVPKLIMTIPRDTEGNYQNLMKRLLVNYVDETADLHVIRTGVSYILQTLNTRKEREEFLTELLKAIGRQNSFVYSEIATKIAFLKAEKADANSAISHLISAHSKNKYNQLAFEKITELIGQPIKPSIYLTHLRDSVTLNPLNLDSALAFARQAEIAQLYELAADAYQYTAELFTFLYPSESLPPDIYIPWAINCYNTTRKVTQCLKIAAKVRDSGRFDLFIEAIAGKAALKAGNEKQAQQILQNAEAKAIELIQNNKKTPDTTIPDEQQVAWFQCFVTQEPNEAIHWANRAYAKDPNSSTAAAFLAQALTMNGQMDWPKVLIEDYEPSQISQLVLAKTQLAEGKKSAASESLKSAIDRDPASFVAEQAEKILSKLGQQYIPPIDPAIILTALKNRFGENIAPKFTPPDKLIRVALKLRGRQFSYAGSFDAGLSITNKSNEPLLIADNGLFTGNIRIDANVTGDIRKQIPGLITKQVMPAFPIQSGRSYSVPIRLITGRLKDILLSHPQASVKIDFTTYLDPIVTENGLLENGIPQMQPAKTTAERTPLKITEKFLQNRLDSLARGRQAQKGEAARLFAGLLKEQQLFSKQKAPYPYIWAEWLPEILISALQQNLADDNWIVKLQTMAAMLKLPLDYKLTLAVSECLNHKDWPVRLTALFLLADDQKTQFQKVLDWTAKQDSNEYVQQMAIALGGKNPEPWSQDKTRNKTEKQDISEILTTPSIR